MLIFEIKVNIVLVGCHHRLSDLIYLCLSNILFKINEQMSFSFSSFVYHQYQIEMITKVFFVIFSINIYIYVLSFSLPKVVDTGVIKWRWKEYIFITLTHRVDEHIHTQKVFSAQWWWCLLFKNELVLMHFT
jgi:hypothetical protein